MKRVKLIVALIALFGATNMANAQTINDVNAKFNEAAALIQSKNFAKAIPILEATVNLGLAVGDDALVVVQSAQGYLPVCNFQVGLGYCRDGKFKDAIPYLDRAAELSELYGDMKTGRNAATLLSQAYYTMGTDAYNSGDYSSAIALFAKGYEANPTDTKLGLALAASYTKSGDLDNGIKVYSEIAALTHSKYAEAVAEAKARIVEELGSAASNVAKAGNTEEAYALIDRILDIDATNATALMLRLQLASNAKEYSNVIRWGAEVAEAQSDGASKSTAWFLLGAAYQNTEKLDEALTIYAKVTEGPYAAEAKRQVAEIQKAKAAPRR